MAANSYPVKFTELLFKFCPDVPFDQWELLKKAMDNEDKSTLEWLIDNDKFDYNVRDEYGNGIIHYLMDFNAHLIPKLIDKGVDPNMVNEQNETALVKYLSRKKSSLPRNVDLSLFNLNIASSYGMSALLFLAAYNGERFIEPMIKAGANVNYTSIKNGSPLLRAIKEIDVDMVRILINIGADTKLAPEGWLKPLQYAKQLKSNAGDYDKEKLDEIITILKAK